MRTILETLAQYAQRTHHPPTTLTLFALVLSGRAGERLLAHIGMSTGADTLVRLAKRAEFPSIDVPEVLRCMILRSDAARPTG